MPQPPPPPPSTPPPPPPPPGGPVGVPRPSPYDPSHPSGLSNSARTYATFIHLSSFAGLVVSVGFLAVVGPLVMWLIRRDEHPFLDHHGKEAVNFNLSVLLYMVVGFVAALVTFGLGLVVVIPVLVILFVVWVVFTIMAAVAANRGDGFRYPLTIRFITD